MTVKLTSGKAAAVADILEDAGKPADIAEKAAAELRRLHAELERCKQVCAATSESWRIDAEKWKGQRLPLTEEEIQELSQQHKFDSRMEKFVRIIERAHGIGGQP